MIGIDTTLLSTSPTSIAANPFTVFKFTGGAKGDPVKVTWIDSRGDTRSDEVAIT